MQARMSIMADPDAYEAMHGLEDYLAKTELAKSTLELVKIRASQINGCGLCVDMHNHEAKADGESDERLWSVVTWREAPFFTPAERAALALTEQATRLDPGGVSDEVWNEVCEHYDESTRIALVTAIATINAWNRFGVTLRTPAGAYRNAS